MTLLSMLLLPAVADQERFNGRDLTSYVQRVLSENAELKLYQHRYRAALERTPQMSALPDPMLQITHFLESVQTRTGPQENVVMLNQRIPWFGKLKSRERAGTAEAAMFWYAYQNQRLVLVRDVSLTFYEYAYLEQAQKLTRESLELLQRLEPVVETRVKTGGELNGLLRLKVEIGKMNDRLQSLTQKRETLSAELRTLLALPGEGIIPWPEWEKTEIVSPAAAPLTEDWLWENPELQMLRQKAASAEARKAAADLEVYPDFVLGVNYMQIGEPEVNPATPDAGKDAWGVTAAISLPLWGGKTQAARQEARENLQAAEQEVIQKKHELRAELASALAKLSDAQRRLLSYGDDLLVLARQAVENSLRSYEVGQAGILEVIDSERSLVELELLYWRAAVDVCQQSIRIQTLINNPVTEIP